MLYVLGRPLLTGPMFLFPAVLVELKKLKAYTYNGDCMKLVLTIVFLNFNYRHIYVA